jgi:hypothetical protein
LLSRLFGRHSRLQSFHPPLRVDFRLPHRYVRFATRLSQLVLNFLEVLCRATDCFVGIDADLLEIVVERLRELIHFGPVLGLEVIQLNKQKDIRDRQENQYPN